MPRHPNRPKIPFYKLELGTKLRHVRNPKVTCVIIDYKRPPGLSEVQYMTGNKRRWSGSHLRKYYRPEV